MLTIYNVTNYLKKIISNAIGSVVKDNNTYTFYQKDVNQLAFADENKKYDYLVFQGEQLPNFFDRSHRIPTELEYINITELHYIVHEGYDPEYQPTISQDNIEVPEIDYMRYQLMDNSACLKNVEVKTSISRAVHIVPEASYQKSTYSSNILYIIAESDYSSFKIWHRNLIHCRIEAEKRFTLSPSTVSQFRLHSPDSSVDPEEYNRSCTNQIKDLIGSSGKFINIGRLPQELMEIDNIVHLSPSSQLNKVKVNNSIEKEISL